MSKVDWGVTAAVANVSAATLVPRRPMLRHGCQSGGEMGLGTGQVAADHGSRYPHTRAGAIQLSAEVVDKGQKVTNIFLLQPRMLQGEVCAYRTREAQAEEAARVGERHMNAGTITGPLLLVLERPSDLRSAYRHLDALRTHMLRCFAAAWTLA